MRTRNIISKGLAALLTTATLLAISAATCENQDYRALETFNFNTKAGEDPLLRTVVHPYSGRNTMDFVLVNHGDAPMRIRLTAATVRPTDDDGLDAGIDTNFIPDIPIFLPPSDLGEDVTPDEPDTNFSPADFVNNLGEDSPNLSQRTILVGPKEERIGRFGEEEGLIGITLIVKIECLTDVCHGKIDFVVLLGRLECRNDDDCSSDQICKESAGRCIANPNITGCQTTPHHRPTPTWPLLLITTALLIAWMKKRHIKPHPNLLALLILIALGFTASQASANRAVFAQPTSQLTFSGGMKFWTGALADDTDLGLTMDVTEALHYRFLGFQLSIGTAYFLTKQSAPPLSKGMQTYSLRLGPRLIIPIKDFRFFMDLEYERLGLISNSLVRITGPDLSYNAVGTGITMRYLAVPFLLDVKVGYTQVFGLDAGIVGFWLSLGRLGRL